ncbi:hypothetical protein [Streptomyces radicis]|uniref:Secreted protein n=1 Tax=Streptomyces radicis TaxID=1750517 RepID=A0A3A9VZF2_9ACTN|nr:hypothetical protein [Streptomyces radicis]RKN05553.1 hypothetical protein D7319_25090 [Streptomyces radicis]RKN17422.1 hypothetical protein D7318_24455 [Streptomyces radicis]
MTHLSRALLTTTAATGAVLATAGAASAQQAPAQGGVASTLPVVADSLDAAISPAFDLHLYPLANTTADLLDNSVGTAVADFPPLSTELATGPLSDGASIGELPGATAQSLLGGLPVALS